MPASPLAWTHPPGSPWRPTQPRGLHKLLSGSAKPNYAASMIEAWDCDRNAGVLRVVAAPGSTAPDRQIPLASLTILSWQGVEEISDEGEYFCYDLGLFLEDDSHTGLPTSVAPYSTISTTLPWRTLISVRRTSRTTFFTPGTG